MEKWLSEWSPIMDVEHDCIVSKQGDISIAFKAELPEIFTLSDENYETLHQGLIKAIKVLPKEAILHKQDYFTQSVYEPVLQDNASFLTRASERYFTGRKYFNHDCYFILTKRPKGAKASSSALSSLIRQALVPDQVLSSQALQDFEDVCGQFQRILADSGIALVRLTDQDLLSTSGKAGLIERYCSLSNTKADVLIKDIQTKDGLQIGDQYVQLYTLADTEDLPALCGSRINYDTYSTDRTKFSIGFASTLGLLLPCNHVYNQYILVSDLQATLKKLENKRLRLQALAAYSRENAIARDAVNDFLNECISQSRTPVRAHFNVLVWTDNKSELKDIKNLVTSALAQMNASAKQETAGAAQIFWAGIPGNAGDFPINDTFETFAEQACCFLNLETNYGTTTPDKGIRFCDRLSGKPVYVDLFDYPRTAGWTSNMGTLICGSSGGGKSMLTNAILRALYDQGAHCVVVDIGGSYKGLCELVGGYYFTYTEQNPIAFNPFYLPEGMVLDTEKKESLKALLVALWKQDNEFFGRSEYVALSNAIQGYYQLLTDTPDTFPCFNTFYEYLETGFVEELQRHKLKDKDFDVANFLYVLRPYYKGGEFDYLLNATGKLDILDQPFIVIEIDNIKDNVILFPVVCLTLIELFISKMRKLAGVRKVLTIDEAWKAIAKTGMAEFLKYAFKTIRKFNGIPIVITQELDDLVSSPVIKDAIINNADVKILMDMKKFMNKFDRLQETLGMSDKGKTQVLSVNKENREIYLDLGGHVMKVLKNELCPEEYWAFTTEGKERVKVQEYAAKYGSMEKGIERLVAELNNNK